LGGIAESGEEDSVSIEEVDIKPTSTDARVDKKTL
jgi:hypothetical protein